MNIKEKYKKIVIPGLREKFKYTNDLAVPRIVKVTLNIGLGKSLKDEKLVGVAVDVLTRISGQKPMLTKAKKSISAFKIRAGMVVGSMVTLRGKRMYNFLEKLLNIALPRVRDFQGILEKSVDQGGNLTIGFREQIVFPEIHSDEVDHLIGLEVIITTTAGSAEVGRELFRLLGIPFKKK